MADTLESLRCTAAVWSGRVSIHGADIPKQCGNRGPRCYMHREGARYYGAPDYVSEIQFTATDCGIRMRRFEAREHATNCKACARRRRWHRPIRALEVKEEERKRQADLASEITAESMARSPAVPDSGRREVMRHNGRIWFEDWSMPDPEHEPLHEALRAARHDLARLTQAQAFAICEAAQAYLHLAAHPAGTEAVVAQLRMVRKALKSAPFPEKPSPIPAVPTEEEKP